MYFSFCFLISTLVLVTLYDVTVSSLENTEQEFAGVLLKLNQTFAGEKS